MDKKKKVFDIELSEGEEVFKGCEEEISNGDEEGEHEQQQTGNPR